MDGRWGCQTPLVSWGRMSRVAELASMPTGVYWTQQGARFALPLRQRGRANQHPRLPEHTGREGSCTSLPAQRKWHTPLCFHWDGGSEGQRSAWELLSHMWGWLVRVRGDGPRIPQWRCMNSQNATESSHTKNREATTRMRKSKII